MSDTKTPTPSSSRPTCYALAELKQSTRQLETMDLSRGSTSLYAAVCYYLGSMCKVNRIEGEDCSWQSTWEEVDNAARRLSGSMDVEPLIEIIAVCRRCADHKYVEVAEVEGCVDTLRSILAECDQLDFPTSKMPLHVPNGEMVVWEAFAGLVNQRHWAPSLRSSHKEVMDLYRDFAGNITISEVNDDSLDNYFRHMVSCGRDKGEARRIANQVKQVVGQLSRYKFSQAERMAEVFKQSEDRKRDSVGKDTPPADEQPREKAIWELFLSSMSELTASLQECSAAMSDRLKEQPGLVERPAVGSGGDQPLWSTYLRFQDDCGRKIEYCQFSLTTVRLYCMFAGGNPAISHIAEATLNNFYSWLIAYRYDKRYSTRARSNLRNLAKNLTEFNEVDAVEDKCSQSNPPCDCGVCGGVERKVSNV